MVWEHYSTIFVLCSVKELIICNLCLCSMRICNQIMCDVCRVTNAIIDKLNRSWQRTGI